MKIQAGFRPHRRNPSFCKNHYIFGSVGEDIIPPAYLHASYTSNLCLSWRFRGNFFVKKVSTPSKNFNKGKGKILVYLGVCKIGSLREGGFGAYRLFHLSYFSLKHFQKTEFILFIYKVFEGRRELFSKSSLHNFLDKPEFEKDILIQRAPAMLALAGAEFIFS